MLRDRQAIGKLVVTMDQRRERRKRTDAAAAYEKAERAEHQDQRDQHVDIRTRLGGHAARHERCRVSYRLAVARHPAKAASDGNQDQLR